MKKSELIQILTILRNTYNNFTFDDFKENLWFDLLQDLPDGTGLANVREHVMSNKYPPTIADIRTSKEEEIEEDPEIRARNIEIALSAWVRDGNDPEAFVYESDGGSIKRLRT